MKTLGILLSTPPSHKNRITVANLAHEAMHQGIKTYLYLIDEGVENVTHPEIACLAKAGVTLFICSYGAHQRGLSLKNAATPAGLVVLSDLIKGCDRFITFN